MDLTNEQKLAIGQAWNKVVKWFREIMAFIKKRVHAFVISVKRAFISACLDSERLRTRALIYIHTKNRRIKRKQFKWLTKTVFGG